MSQQALPFFSAIEAAPRAMPRLESPAPCCTLCLSCPIREANAELVAGMVRAATTAEAAEQLDHLKDEFVATVSHELRTPLNAILGWARMLDSNQLAPERVQHATAAIVRSATMLAHMVDDLLDMSRIVEGTLCLTSERVDLVDTTSIVVEAARPLAAARHIELEFRPTAVLPTIGDPVRLQQVVSNLVANAIKFTPEHGRVQVFVESSKYYVEVRVVDTGRGIGADLLPHVFERFRQGSEATTQRGTGLGLGLFIVRRLVEAHGGTVQASSEGPGRGATFTVRLPTAPSEVSAAGPETNALRLEGLRILVVDGSADGRALTTSVLTDAGAVAKAVASASDALQWLAVERPDALVSGIRLPDMDGCELIRHIRNRAAPDGDLFPAVALTSCASPADRARILAAGFRVHIPKPVGPRELVAAIAAVTQSRRANST